MQTEEHKQRKRNPKKISSFGQSSIMNVSRQFFFLSVVLLVFILAILMAGHVHNFDKHNFANPPVNSFFNIFHYFFSMPPTPKSAKMSGCCCWGLLLLGGTTFEIRHLYLCTKKFGASNLSQFWRLKALFIIILALNALFNWRRRRFL